MDLIVDMTLHFDSKLVAQNKWPAIDLTEMTSVPTLAAQPKLLSTLSGGLYHMQVAARETIKQTAAARHLSYLAKQAQQRQQTTALISKEIVTGFTFRKYTAPFLDNTEADRLLELLHLYGPHYQHEFAVDMKHRLYQQNVSRNQFK